MKKLLNLGLLLAAVAAAHAAPSQKLIPFQGRLTDQQGRAYPNGQYTIVFTLYNQAVGGTPLNTPLNVGWIERHQKVGVVNGMVNVFLGSIRSLDGVDFSTTVYLGITIDADDNPNTADPEMVPRQMIIPAFWAKNSEKLAGYDWSSILIGGGNNPVAGQIAGSKIQTGGITSAQITNGAITANQLAAGAVTGNAIANGSISSNQIAIGAVTSTAIANGTITANQIALQTITSDRVAPRVIGTNVPVGGLALSASCGSFTSPDAAVRTIIGSLTVTIATQGHPVEVSFVSDGSTNDIGSYFEVANVTISPSIYLNLLRDGVDIGYEVAFLRGNASGMTAPPSAFKFLDFPPPGTHNYQVQIFSGTSANTISANYIRMIAHEL